MSVIRIVMKLCRPYWLLLTAFLLCLIIESVYGALSPLSFKFLIDDAFEPKDIGMFGWILTFLLVGGALAISTGIIGERILALVSERAVYDLRSRLFQQLTRQSLDFFNQFEQGSIMSRLTSDVLTVDRMITGMIPSTLKGMFGLLIGIYVLFQLEWKLALLLLAGFLLLFLSPNLLRGKAVQSVSNYREEQDAYVGAIDEVLKGHRVIKGLNIRTHILKRLEQRLQGMFTTGYRLTYIYALLDKIPLIAFMLLNLGVITYGGYLIFQDDLTVGAFIAFYTIFLHVGQAVSSLSQLIPTLIQSEISFKRLDEILNYETQLIRPENPTPIRAIRQNIQFKHVTFGYDKSSPVLNNVTFEIPAGGLTAFVGSSGSGKSTALQLLLQFYDPDQGALSIDGVDVRQLDEEQFRNLTGVVFQDSFLFNTSIEENIRMSNPTATEQDMQAAAAAATIHGYITGLPDQYLTKIKDYGTNLSGGQRQRISIARALVKNPQLLLLDEVTSALDSATEAEINALIESFRFERTIVTVTHRLASVVAADWIVVFHNGRIAETGTHHELLQLAGVYKEMWDKQNGFSLTSDGFSARINGERLSQLPFFRGIPLEQIEAISELFVTEQYDEGHYLIRENELGDKFYIIVRGSVNVVKCGARVAVLEDGDHFGEIALLHNIPRTADIVTRMPTVLLSLRGATLLELTKDYPTIRHVLEQSLKERLK